MDLEAGDLVITGKDETPAHLMIASLQSVLWEATNPNVRPTGYGIFDTERVVAVYRAGDKQCWLSSEPSL